MEWVLFIATSALDNALDRLGSGDPFPGEQVWQVTTVPGVTAAYGDLAGNGGFGRVYWGCEFCETLIPGAGSTGRLAGKLAERQIPWSLVTPYVTDAGLDRLAGLLAKLPRELHPDEAVVNDWGVLRWLGREQPHIRPVLGRLMNKMIRDPRVATKFEDPRSPQEAKDALKGWSISAGSYQSFLEGKRVTRVEIDNPLQGLAVDFGKEGVAASVYLPFGYVTTGRICLPGSLNVRPADKFSLLGNCRRECGGSVLELKNTRSPIEADRGLRLYQRGNTIFYVQPPDHVTQGLRAAAGSGVDRVIWQPTLPF